MTALDCPKSAVWLRLVDRQLSEEVAAELRDHAETCAACGQQAAKARRLADRLGGEASSGREGAVKLRGAILAGINSREAPARPPRFPWPLAASALACLSAAFLLVQVGGGQGRFAARGAVARHSLGRDVGISFYATSPRLRPLRDGDALGAETPLVTSYRNLSAREVFLRVVAVDASGREQWVQPQSASAPPVRLLPGQAAETPLPETVVLASPAPGPLRLVALVTSEQGPAPEVWVPGALRARYPRASVQTVELQVVRE